MRLALALARRGHGFVAPNPMVGCVIVKNGRVIAQGWHKKWGDDHAEIAALKKIKFQAQGATLYVNLEPCHHHGKTPPCVDVVIRSGVKRVVIAMIDPNPKTHGRSVQKMRQSGIQVECGLCSEDAQEINRGFIKHIQTGLPYVIGKVAMSLDGKIAAVPGKQTWLTGKKSFGFVQSLRAFVDAILVGRHTVEVDDPKLTVRDAQKPQPCRVILDAKASLKISSRVFRRPGAKIIIVVNRKFYKKALRRFSGFADVLCVGENKMGLDLRSVLCALGKQGINKLLVEGGGAIFTSFLASGLVDEWHILVAPKVLGEKGVKAFSCVWPSELIWNLEESLGPDWHFSVRHVTR
jgi:diaminohydroxyphosphoribosylaminopyrimidine deaminase/5-amino-6-(5-phosphoribosylamino)uracil reductase